MPLHDWTNDAGWDGFHALWINRLFHHIKPRLPDEFRAYLGSVPNVDEPDLETATMVLDPRQALYITYRGRLVSAVELISPRNKDRPSSRTYYLARYLGYLREGSHLLLVDVHRRPLAFSFADSLAQELQIAQPPTPAPLAGSYRVGEPAATGGRLLAIWRRILVVGSPLPTMPLPLTTHAALDINLEETYMLAAGDAYLE